MIVETQSNSQVQSETFDSKEMEEPLIEEVEETVEPGQIPTMQESTVVIEELEKVEDSADVVLDSQIVETENEIIDTNDIISGTSELENETCDQTSLQKNEAVSSILIKIDF